MSTPIALEASGAGFTGGEARARLLVETPVIERRLHLAGVSTPVLEGGEGPPMVLLHGPGEFALKWMRVFPGLAATHRVVAPDLPGHGESYVGDGAIGRERVLHWLRELIDRTCASPPVLVGHLLGAAIAARFAKEHASMLDRLVLVDALGLGPFRPAPRFAIALLRFMARPTPRSHEHLWRHCASDLDGLRDRMGEQWGPFEAYNLDRARAPTVKKALRTLMREVGMPAIPPADLARIEVPTTLIWGRHDLATRLRIAEAASRRYGWPLHVIENAADDPAIEQPEAFIDALRLALRTPATARQRRTS